MNNKNLIGKSGLNLIYSNEPEKIRRIPAEETYQIRHKLGQIHHTKKAAVVRGKSEDAGKQLHICCC